jgi:hypothetical protein
MTRHPVVPEAMTPMNTMCFTIYIFFPKKFFMAESHRTHPSHPLFPPINPRQFCPEIAARPADNRFAYRWLSCGNNKSFQFMLRACCIANEPRVGAAHFGGKYRTLLSAFYRGQRELRNGQMRERNER